MYKQIEVKKETFGTCYKCGAALGKHGSPWSICYDPYYIGNCWGGDTHQSMAEFCQQCAEEILAMPATK